MLFDIETSALEGDAWVTYDARLLDITKDWTLLSFAYKFLGSKATRVVTRQGQKSDKAITKKLWEVLSKADVLIAHNGDRFDIPKANAKFLEHGLTRAVPRLQSIDTLKVARRNFALTSNRLNGLAELLGLGKKIDTGGYELWKSIKKNDPKAWKLMAKYNKHDVKLLEQVYLKLRKWDDVGNKKLTKIQESL